VCLYPPKADTTIIIKPFGVETWVVNWGWEADSPGSAKGKGKVGEKKLHGSLTP